MNEIMNSKDDCNTFRNHLADLLLDAGYLSKHPEVETHMIACADCRAELEGLKATFALLDSWVAPEPSAYFDVKLHARLREAEHKAPDGLWHRLRSYLAYSTERDMRPVMAGALAIVLMLGGSGIFVGLYQHSNMQSQVSPTVNDLKIMDSNAQALQQMDQLLDPSKDDGSSTTPIT